MKGREALRNVHFTADSAGRLKIWKHPEQSVSTDRYLTIVDIGGRSDTSDYSRKSWPNVAATPTTTFWRGTPAR